MSANGSQGSAFQNVQSPQDRMNLEGQGSNINKPTFVNNPADVMQAIGKIVEEKQNDFQNKDKITQEVLDRTATQLMEQVLKLIPQNK